MCVYKIKYMIQGKNILDIAMPFYDINYTYNKYGTEMIIAEGCLYSEQNLQRGKGFYFRGRLSGGSLAMGVSIILHSLTESLTIIWTPQRAVWLKSTFTGGNLTPFRRSGGVSLWDKFRSINTCIGGKGHEWLDFGTIFTEPSLLQHWALCIVQHLWHFTYSWWHLNVSKTFSIRCKST